MKMRILALVLIAVISPFIGGAKGCGGALKFGDEEALLDEGAADALNVDAAIEQPADALVDGEEGSGAADIICPERERERVVPNCAGFLPAGADAIMIADLGRYDFKKLEEVDWMPAIVRGLDVGGILREPAEMLRQISSVCLACTLKPANVAAGAPGTMVPGAAPAGGDAFTASGEKTTATMMAAASDKDRFRLDMCDQLIGVISFKEGQNIGAASVVKDVNADADGLYALNKRILVGELKDNLFIGTRDYVKAAMAGPKEYDVGLMANFMPSSAIFSASSAVLQAGFKSPFFDVFKVLPLSFDAFIKMTDTRIIAAIDLQKIMIVGAEIFDAANVILAKAVLALPIEEFQKLLQAQKEVAEYLQVNISTANQAAAMDQKDSAIVDQMDAATFKQADSLMINQDAMERTTRDTEPIAPVAK